MEAWGRFDAAWFWCAMLVGVAVGGWSIRRAAARRIREARPFFTIYLTLSSGEVDALKTKDQRQAESLVAALREAIGRHAVRPPPAPQTSVESPAIPEEAEPEDTPGTKECPMCAELVKARARICRYCRHEFGDSAS